MSYDVVEDLWLTRVQAMSEFNADNSGRGTLNMLHTGKGSRYAILYPGEHLHMRQAMGGAQENLFRTRIQLWQPLKEDGTTSQELAALAEDVRQELDKYRLLGDTTNTVSSARVTTTQPMEVRRLIKDGPIWLMVELIGEVQHEESITFAE